MIAATSLIDFEATFNEFDILISVIEGAFVVDASFFRIAELVTPNFTHLVECRATSFSLIGCHEQAFLEMEEGEERLMNLFISLRDGEERIVMKG